MSQERVLLEETFYVLTKKNSVFRVRLTENGLSLIKESENQVKEQTIPAKDIIGCKCLRSRKAQKFCACQSLPRSSSLHVVDENSADQDDSDMSAYLYIYAYILQHTKSGCVKRERTIITLRFRSFDKYEDNNKEAHRWRTTIKYLIKGGSCSSQDLTIMNKLNEEKKLLVLCNPKSGPGKGKVIFQDRIAPILQEAEIPYELQITKYANYAREFVRTCNLLQWSGVVVVGGDGIVFEVINGIFERPDWTNAIQNLPIAVVPGGSGNGLARSIAHYTGEPYLSSPTLPSALSLVHNCNAPMDLIRVENSSRVIFSFLSVGWGLLADIDIESESLRILGGQRFAVWSVARLIGLRSYRGKVFYLPAGGEQNLPTVNGESVKTDVHLPAEVTLETEAGRLETEAGRQRLDSWYSAASRRSAYFSATNSSYQSTTDSGGDAEVIKNKMYGPPSKLPSLSEPLPNSWICMEGKFIMVHASYQSHLSEDCLIAPEAKLNDGLIWLIIIRDGVTRSQMLQFLLGLSSAAHAHNTVSGIEFLPVKAFRIEPNPNERGYISVDGELVEYGPIQAEVFPELCRVMVP